MNKYSILIATYVFLFGVSAATADVSSGTLIGGAAATSAEMARESSRKTLDLNPPPTEKRFWRATGEMIIVGYSPWLFSHYVKDYPYADISMDTVRYNFEHGFVYDTDNFQTNQWGHPFQGSIYYNAGRINGFNFWESSMFALAGDFGWEFFMEAEQPSYNDMVNTWVGGTSRGEMTYRMSDWVLDDRATGSDKFYRELGAGVINPVRFIDRLVFGDMWTKSETRGHPLPNKLFMTVDGGYKHGRDDSAHQNQGYFSVELRQNDPHNIPIKKPFDYFDFNGTISTAKGPLIPYASYRGLLTSWELEETGDVHHMLAPGLSFNYFNNQKNSFGGQGLNLMLLSRWTLPKEYELRTEAGGEGFVFAGIQTDYSEENINAVGRSYDFGSGGGPRLDVRLRHDEVDWFHCSTSAGWFKTNNGLSSQSRIFTFKAEARYPITRDLFAGVGWSIEDRYTLYDTLPATTRTNSGINAFLSYAFRILG